MIQSTAYEGQLYTGKVKTKASRNVVAIPDSIRPIIEWWRRVCPDTSPQALMFPTFGRQGRKGARVPRHAKNFLKWRIHPIADQQGIPRKLVTFQVMRRTLGTDLQRHGTMKDIQGALRRASIKTAGDVYVQPIASSVRAAINVRTQEILDRLENGALTWQPEGNHETPDAMQPNATQLENSSAATA